jgi:putative aminopeptidase FrvX
MTRRILVLMIGLTVAGAVAAQEKPAAWDILRDIVLVPGVSGHEKPVADFVVNALPAGVKVERDALNNVWFTAGSGKPHILVVAHTDELGWIVDRITAEGRLKLKPGGGVLPQASEARAVLIHTAKGPVAGVIAPRPGYDERAAEGAAVRPYGVEDFEIVLGVGGEKEARALGVAEGDSVTIKKAIVDLGPDLLATRAVDDRAGCAALLEAASRIDWAGLKGKTVTFAWDVQEEIGLFGAAALAKVLRPDAVFAVDTFVSSDSPLESKRFAYAVIGGGAVVRAIDSSSVVPRAELRRILGVARDHGIALQVGSSRGGNDGSVFVPWGAVDIPLAWPGAYAHSFIEKIDRRDLAALTDLIVAIVRDW